MKQLKKQRRIAARMEAMRRDLGLRMPPALFSVAVEYYQREERREPTPDELLLLERHSAILTKSRHSITVGELFTNDSFVAETYADMMEKRQTLDPNHTQAPRLSTLLHLADDYLYRSGKPAQALPALHAEPITAHTAIATPSRPVTEGAAFALRLLDQAVQPACPGDLLLLLSPGTENLDLEHRLNTLLPDPTRPNGIRELCKIGDLGLLADLLALPLGAELSAARLLRNHKSLLSSLTDTHVGDYLMRVAPDAFETVAKWLLAAGLRATAFARLISEDRISVRSAEGHLSIDLSKEFLARFYLPQGLTATLADEKHPIQTMISHKPLTCGASKYLDLPADVGAASVTVMPDATLISTASCRPTSDFFLSALDTALTAILTLAASGIPTTEQSLVIGLSIPRSYREPEQLGAALSIILGLYRVQAELSVRTAEERITTLDTPPALSVFALAKGNPCPEHFSTADSYLSLMVPAFEQNGAPNFNALRRFLQALVTLSESGMLRSARILAHESLSDALDGMQTATLTYQPTDPDSLSDRKPRLAILCETSAPIDAELLGRVVKQEIDVTKEESADEASEDQGVCLIPSSRPSIVLYADREDLDADLLAEYLAGYDVTLTRICPDEVDAELHLCHAVLTSQALIVGSDVTLPATETVKFAVGTLVRANGKIFYPARTKLPVRSKGIVLPNGFSEKILNELCVFEK